MGRARCGMGTFWQSEHAKGRRHQLDEMAKVNLEPDEVQIKTMDEMEER